MRWRLDEAVDGSSSSSSSSSSRSSGSAAVVAITVVVEASLAAGYAVCWLWNAWSVV